jgi:hypothetical protein
VLNLAGWQLDQLSLTAPTDFNGSLRLQVQATAIETATGERATAQAEDFGKLYLRVPVEAAQRALRFYKVRRGTDKAAA